MSMIREVLAGAWSLVVGMMITLRNLWGTLFGDKLATELYPHTKPELPEAFRGPIKFVTFDETQTHDCIACNACENICPSFCIKVEGEKVDGLKRKRPTLYEMDFAACSLCGLCIDVCPTDTLEFSKSFDDAGYTDNWIHDLMEPYAEREDSYREEQRAVEAKAAEEKKRKAAARKAKAAKAKAAKEAAEKEAAEKEAADSTPATANDEGAPTASDATSDAAEPTPATQDSTDPTPKGDA